MAHKPPFNSVAVIGAGPSGLACAKALLAEQAFTKIVIFEQQSQAGGVWNYRPKGLDKKAYSGSGIERDDSNTNSDTVDGVGNPGGREEKYIYTSPMYKHLDTNIPKHLMRFNDYDFPSNAPLFPSRSNVLEYIQEYAKPVEKCVRYNSRVTSVSKQEDGTWATTYSDYCGSPTTPRRLENTQEAEISADKSGDGPGYAQMGNKATEHTERSYTELFDAIIIATGHYELPYIPQVDGLSEWTAQFCSSSSSSVIHSKYFDDPEKYTNKTVLVVGNSASGRDISLQLARCAKQVYRSVKSLPPTPTPPSLSASSSSPTQLPLAVDDPRIINVPVIERYDTKNKTIVLDKSQEGFDLDSYELKHVDIVIYCTGYLYNFPFLKSYMDQNDPDSIISKASSSSSSFSLSSSSSPSSTTRRETTSSPAGDRLNRLYRQTFYIPDPSLTFVCMPTSIVPFPLAETQAAAIARYYSGRLLLPSDEAMRQEERDREELKAGEASVKKKTADEAGNARTYKAGADKARIDKAEIDKVGKTGVRKEKEKEKEETKSCSGREFHNFGYPDDVQFYKQFQEWTRSETRASKVLAKDQGFWAEEWTAEREEERKNSKALKMKAIGYAIRKELEKMGKMV